MQKKLFLGTLAVILAMALMPAGQKFWTQRIAIPSSWLAQPTPSSTPSTVLGITDQRGFEEALVAKVVDGDTIELSDGRKVRYIGMNTPETHHPTKGKECFGEAASARNTELVLGKTVQLEKDVSETDRYGRLLRYVWLGETLINQELVAEGYAFASSYPPDIGRQDSLKKAEAEARIDNRGLWASCDTVDLKKLNETITTAEPTMLPTGATQSGLQTECVIKGNISEKGKLYHLPSCGSYAATKINESTGERWFCSETEAQAAGWTKASSC
jgi:micrococcal nuclease